MGEGLRGLGLLSVENEVEKNMEHNIERAILFGGSGLRLTHREFLWRIERQGVWNMR